MRPKFDEQDEQIRRARLRMFDARPSAPRVGDYVEFADGVVRRVSNVWRNDNNEAEDVQTSDGGSWYFGDGYCSFSGGLFQSVKVDTLTLTPERRDGLVWFFHHDLHQAHNGVDTSIPFRVYKCSEEAPR